MHNQGPACFNIISLIKMVEDVDIPAMQRAASEAIRYYPELSIRPVVDSGGRILAESFPADDLPKVCFYQDDDVPRYIGTEDTNGYLFFFICKGKTMFLNAFHGMSDAKGLTEYFRTMLYLYSKEKGIFTYLLMVVS